MRHYILEYVKIIETLQNVFQVFNSTRLLVNAKINTFYSVSTVTRHINATSCLSRQYILAVRI
jgi:hypothetical protein